MIYTENKAIEFLINNLDADDTATSSHWKKYHKDFSVGKDFDISGIVGFGGNSKKFRGIYKLAHIIFQNRYRRLGKDYSNFELIDSKASEMTKLQKRAYDLDVLRQTLTLSLLMNHFNEVGGGIGRSVAVIGDGFASLSLLLLMSGFAKKVVLVNLSKTLLVDLLYFQKYNNKNRLASFVLVTEKEDSNKVKDFDLIAIQASNHEFLKFFPIDIFINIASMQEMNPEVISGYFDDMREVAKRQDSFFYCCNRIEKTFPDGTTVRFRDYPWSSLDQVIIDELCPWHQKYYSLKPPFYHPYDGPIQHRLIKIAKDV